MAGKKSLPHWSFQRLVICDAFYNSRPVLWHAILQIYIAYYRFDSDIQLDGCTGRFELYRTDPVDEWPVAGCNGKPYNGYIHYSYGSHTEYTIRVAHAGQLQQWRI